MLELTRAQLEAVDEIIDRLKALAIVDHWPSARAEFLELQASLNKIAPPATARPNPVLGGFKRAGF